MVFLCPQLQEQAPPFFRDSGWRLHKIPDGKGLVPQHELKYPRSVGECSLTHSFLHWQGDKISYTTKEQDCLPIFSITPPCVVLPRTYITCYSRHRVCVCTYSCCAATHLGHLGICTLQGPGKQLTSRHNPNLYLCSQALYLRQQLSPHALHPSPWRVFLSKKCTSNCTLTK